MIEITEIRPAGSREGWSFTATIDDQRVEDCQYVEYLNRKLWMPPAAASIAWGQYSLSDVEAAAKVEIQKIGEPRNV